jgi:homoserine dehydrogenase
VVTANKALLAVHGTKSSRRAEKGVMVALKPPWPVAFPSSRPARRPDRQPHPVAAIINGTTNFILSEMRDKGLDFDVVLKEAQRLGYAEADPTFDIEAWTPPTRPR